MSPYPYIYIYLSTSFAIYLSRHYMHMFIRELMQPLMCHFPKTTQLLLTNKLESLPRNSINYSTQLMIQYYIRYRFVK